MAASISWIQLHACCCQKSMNKLVIGLSSFDEPVTLTSAWRAKRRVIERSNVGVTKNCRRPCVCGAARFLITDILVDTPSIISHSTHRQCSAKLLTLIIVFKIDFKCEIMKIILTKKEVLVYLEIISILEKLATSCENGNYKRRLEMKRVFLQGEQCYTL